MTSWGASELSVHFGKRTALDSVTFQAPAGQVRAVVGGDGAGKTTLLRVLAGALVPDTGTVHQPPVARIGPSMRLWHIPPPREAATTDSSPR